MKKWILIFLALLLCLPLTALATIPGEEEFAPENRQLIDKADLLTYEEEASLRRELQEASEELGTELAVVTMQSLGEYDIDWFLNTLYDEGGYGYGSSRSGVLLLICMQTREYRILSNGYAGDTIGDYEIDRIGDAFVSDLSAGNYYDAFETFTSECRDFLTGNYDDYYDYDYDDDYSDYGEPLAPETKLVICLVIGLVVSGIVMFVLYRQLKSVRKQPGANAYIRPGSLQLTQVGDYYMYRHVSRTAKPQNNGSHGGDGGSRHSGGGRF